MSNKIQANLKRFLDDHEMMVFCATVLALCLVSYWLAVNLPALVVAVLLAYLLDGLVSRLCKLNIPRGFAIGGTLTICILTIFFLLLVGIPKITEQISTFATQLPENLPSIQKWLDDKLELMPFGQIFDSNSLIGSFRAGLSSFGESAVSTTFTNVVGLFNLVVYIVLIPLLLFFTLRDKNTILNWLGSFIPHSTMLQSLRIALNEQFGAYVRGKIIEGTIISLLSLIGFLFLDVNYALALAFAIGLSVVIPFVGAVVVTVPVIAAGLVQFGFSSDFWWMFGFYLLIQVLDGQLLVPLLFSEVVKIHPVAILVAILFFGAIWGIWGVFFAIPLASLIKSVIAVINKHLSAASAAASA